LTLCEWGREEGRGQRGSEARVLATTATELQSGVALLRDAQFVCFESVALLDVPPVRLPLLTHPTVRSDTHM